MPAINVLKPQKTVHYPLGPIPHDESSNSGNLAVLENIFRKQYGLSDEAFEKRLFLIFGDQKTIQRIRALERRRERSIRAYDSPRWALPVPALFHLQMNLVFMMTRVYFGGEDRDQSSIYDAMNYGRRKKISKGKSDFIALEELIIHSFQARIAAILWRRLASAGLGDSHADIDRMLRAQTPNSFSSLINDIANEYSVKGSINVEDQELRNYYLFLQHVQTYLLLKYAIKHADFGLIKRVIERCSIYFYGSQQRKYAYEMLYLYRLISTPAASVPLQRAILANELVNLRGQPDSWMETDRLAEPHNSNMKGIFKAGRGSINLQFLFQHYSLN